MRRRLPALDAVPPEKERPLRVVKALVQGAEFHHRTVWWPALLGLTAEEVAFVRARLRDAAVWRACGTLVGRWLP